MMLNAEQKVKHVEDFVLLVSEAKTYESALSHCTYTKGMVGAWHLDGTIPTSFYQQVWEDLDTIMTNKRKLF
jgi:hypothetical protein